MIGVSALLEHHGRLRNKLRESDIHASCFMCGMIVIGVLYLLCASSALAEVDLVKVDKSENRMYLMDGGNALKEYHMAFGANPKGHKQKEGDERTPEGTYTLDYKKEDSAFYRAMHISYPNEMDKENARKHDESPGGFIMVHGQKTDWVGLHQFSRIFTGRMAALL